MTPEEYVKKHLKKTVISNLRGIALGLGSNMKIYNLNDGPVFEGLTIESQELILSSVETPLSSNVYF